MSLGEFDLIGQYFNIQHDINSNGVAIGIGDDCAILDIPDGHQLAVSTDTLVSGVHFFADVDPYRLGYKALAVNLSDLAAMGATPKWASLAITLPEINEPWISEFSRGFFALAEQYNVSLVGGDTTKGPLSITISVKGIVPRGLALQRSQAQNGELICVSGQLGAGGLGLDCLSVQQQVSDAKYFIDALELTDPRVELGIQLRGLASSCIDISDGLTQDLGHILHASDCVAQLNIDNLPLSDGLKKEVENGSITLQKALQYGLTGGDDYELLFTINPDNLAQLIALYHGEITVIGRVLNHQSIRQPSIQTSQSKREARTGHPLIQLFLDNQEVSFSHQGWDHFQQGKN